MFAALALAGFAHFADRPIVQGMTSARLRVLCLCGVLLALHWVMFFISVKVGGIAVATLGFASFPAFITLIERLGFKASIAGQEWLVLLIVTAGLVLITPSFDLADEGTAGLLWGLGSGFFFALLAICNRRAASGIDPIQVALWQNLVVAVLVLPFAASAITSTAPTDWFWLVLLGVIATALSHFLFVSSLVELDARRAGLVIALEPVYAIAFAWALFSEAPGVRMMAGAGLVIFGIVLSARSPAAV